MIRNNHSASACAARLLVFLLLAFVASGTGLAQLYVVGQRVDPSLFSMENRRLWYRDDGQPVRPGESLELSFFEGKIVFVEWFKYW